MTYASEGVSFWVAIKKRLERMGVIVLMIIIERLSIADICWKGQNAGLNGALFIFKAKIKQRQQGS